MDYQVKRHDGKLISYKLVGHNTVPVEVSLLNKFSSYRSSQNYLSKKESFTISKLGSHLVFLLSRANAIKRHLFYTME